MDITSREFQKEIGKHIDMAAAGEPVVISRHGRPAVVVIPHEQWRQMSFTDPRWRSVLDRMAAQWPKRKSDYELITDLLQRWEIDQESGNSKTDLLYALLYLGLHRSGVSIDEAKTGATAVKNAWKGEQS